jgi:hypothetical protein
MGRMFCLWTECDQSPVAVVATSQNADNGKQSDRDAFTTIRTSLHPGTIAGSFRGERTL